MKFITEYGVICNAFHGYELCGVTYCNS